MAPLCDLLEGFLRSRRGEMFRPEGVRRYGERLALFASWLEGRGVTDVAAIDGLVVAEYRDYCAIDRGNREGTVINALVAIRAFAEWAVARSHMAEDPTRAIRWPRRTRPAPKPLAPAELALLASILYDQEPDDAVELWHHRRNRLACELMYYCGLRLGEVARLTVADVNLVARLVTIRRSKGRDRSVALHPELLAPLAAACAGRGQRAPVIPTENGRAMGPKVLAKIFEVWLPKRGLKISAHRLRHSFGTELLRACGNLAIVQEALGHASPETTRMYTLVDVEDQRPAINRLPSLTRRPAAD